MLRIGVFRSDVRSSKKSLPHKKRISRKLQKKLPVSKKGQKCSMCEQTFNSVDELNAHSACHSVNIVVQPNPFSCQICGLICNDQLSFFQHLKSHYEPTFHSLSMEAHHESPAKEVSFINLFIFIKKILINIWNFFYLMEKYQMKHTLILFVFCVFHMFNTFVFISI